MKIILFWIDWLYGRYIKSWLIFTEIKGGHTPPLQILFMTKSNNKYILLLLFIRTINRYTFFFEEVELKKKIYYSYYNLLFILVDMKLANSYSTWCPLDIEQILKKWPGVLQSTLPIGVTTFIHLNTDQWGRGEGPFFLCSFSLEIRQWRFLSRRVISRKQQLKNYVTAGMIIFLLRNSRYNNVM